LAQPVSTLIQLALHPPYGLCSLETGPTLTTGQYAVKRIRGPINVDCFGIVFHFITIPAPFGYTLGIANRYEERIVQWALKFTDAFGHDSFTQPVDVFEEGIYQWFPEMFPTEIEVFVQVGCTVTVSFIVAL
jgi:hypothetical protein